MCSIQHFKKSGNHEKKIYLKKLDGYPLIRDQVEENVDEDENSILDAEEIERMGK